VLFLHATGLSRRGAPSLPHKQQQTLLAAATPSGVLLWILEDAYAAASDHQAVPAPLRLLDAEQSGPSLALAVAAGSSSSDAALLAVGCGCVALVWDLRQLEVAFRWVLWMFSGWHRAAMPQLSLHMHVNHSNRVRM
jgi:hypothetical protein